MPAQLGVRSQYMIGTTAKFGTIEFGVKFSVEASGGGPPPAHVVRYPDEVGLTAVMLTARARTCRLTVVP